MNNSNTDNKEDKNPYDQVVNITLPSRQLHFLKMLEVPPKDIIADLLYGIEKGYKNALTDNNHPAIEYFLKKKYGQHLFTENQVKQMMAELGAIESLYPNHTTDYKVFNKWDKIVQPYVDLWTLKWDNAKHQRSSGQK